LILLRFIELKLFGIQQLEEKVEIKSGKLVLKVNDSKPIL
jgi:hypothetical protein